MATPSPSTSHRTNQQESAVVEPAAPRVTLRNWFAHPYDSAIAAARTCYAPRLISAEEITDKQRSTIGAATFYSGHHTVYQHAHFEFGLENISRQFVWSFLHAHPFYNSEQQRQRYVRLDRAQAYVPGDGRAFGAAERAGMRKTRDRSGSLRSAGGGVQHHGAHNFGHRAAPLVSHAGC